MPGAVQILALGYTGVCNLRNDRLETPLITAVRCGSESVIAALLRHGPRGGGRVEVVDVLARDSRGRSALHWAADLGHGAGVLGSLLGALPRAPDTPAADLSAAEMFECAPACMCSDMWGRHAACTGMQARRDAAVSTTAWGRVIGTGCRCQ